MKKLTVAIIVLLAFFASFKDIYAATGINRKINFQGKVVNKGTGVEGLNVSDGNYDFKFTLWDSLSAGTSLWSEVWNSGTSQISVGSGIFTVALGTYSTFPQNLNFNSDSLYLGVEYNHDGEMVPRIRMSAVPYAFNAEKVNGLTVTNTTGTLSIGDSKTVTFGDNFMTVNGVGITLDQNLSTDSLVSFAGLSVGGTVSFTGLPVGTGTTVLYVNSSGNLRAGTLPSYAAGNGLGLIGAFFGLGGTLTQTTQIGTSSFSLLFTGLGGTQALFIGSSGTVGVGTTNPTSALEVAGTIKASAWSIGTTGFACNDVNRGCKWYIRENTISDWYVGYNNTADLSYDVALGSSNNDHYQFRVGKYVSNNFVAGMVVTNDGKIGVGTTLPTKKMDVSGDINLTGTIFSSGVSGSSGQVLSSTGTGLQWITVSGSGTTYSYVNGLNNSGGTVGLGGTLTQTTQIGTSGYSLSFLGLGGSQAFYIGSGGYVGIGTTSPGHKLEVVGSGQISTNLGVGGTVTLSGVLASGGAGMLSIDVGGNIISGTAPVTGAGMIKRIVLSPEYSGASLTADDSGTTAVSITSDNTLNSGGIGWKNYYELTSDNSVLQDYTVMIRIALPSDFERWSSGDCPGSECAFSVRYQTGTSSVINNFVSVRINNDDDTPGTPLASLAASTNTAWSQITFSDVSLDDGSAPDWDAANETAVVRIKMGANNGAGAFSRVGDIVLNYVAKY